MAAKRPIQRGGPAEQEPVTLPFEPSTDDTLEGFQTITQETMAIPFVRVLQKLSPQVNKNKPEYVEGAEEGSWYNTVTKMVYGDALHVIVLKFDRIFIEWRPDRGGFVGYHAPENAERLATEKQFGRWKTKEGNSLAENYVYMVLIVGHENEGVCVLSLSSSMIKTARQWNKLMTTHLMPNGRRALPYYLVYSLKTEYRENEKGSWYVPVVSFERYIDAAQYAIVAPERKMLPSRAGQVDYAQLEGEKSKEEAVEF